MAKMSKLQQIRHSIHEVLKLSDHSLAAVDFLLALAISNTRGEGPEPVWGFLEGPPGCGKTELLRTYMGWPQSVFVDELSENALASGYEDEEGRNPSLLPDLDGKVLVVKDFTSIITSPPTLRAKIMGTLRAAFDDCFAKADGRSGLKSYQCRFGLLAAVTDVVDPFLEDDQQLGQRFLIFRMDPGPSKASERNDLLVRVLQTATTKKLWRQTLKLVTQTHATEIRASAQHRYRDAPRERLADVPVEYLRRFAGLADLTVRFRTQPHKEGDPAAPEFGARLVQQLVNLAECRAFADARTSLDETDYAFALRICQDTLPPYMLRLIRSFYRGSPEKARLPSSREQLCVRAHVELGRLSNLLRQWNYVGLVQPENKAFRLTDDTIEALAACGLPSLGGS